MNTLQPSQNPTDAPAIPWFQQLGFRFNPFEHLEASNDPHLSEYLIGHETFAVAWGDAPSLVFAPSGGGKTTMRIYTTRACWLGLGGFHPFPIPYYLPLDAQNNTPASIEEHLQRIMRAAGSSLFLGLAYRPERFLALNASVRQAVVQILESTLPGPLTRYLDILLQEGTPHALIPRLDRTYRLSNPPPRELLLKLCAYFAEMVSTTPSETEYIPNELFSHLIELVMGPLGFSSIFLLVDGADAFPDTVSDASIAMNWIAPLLKELPGWAEKKVFLKCFLPEELREPLAENFAPLLPSLRQAHLVWNPPLLADMIRRRVYVASEGVFGSLDALSNQGLRDVEILLANSVPPLPREALHLSGEVLQSYVRRTGGVAGFLDMQDIEKAITRYRSSTAIPSLKREPESKSSRPLSTSVIVGGKK